MSILCLRLLSFQSRRRKRKTVAFAVIARGQVANGPEPCVDSAIWAVMAFVFTNINVKKQRDTE